MATDLSHLVTNAIVAKLLLECQTNLLISDPERAGIVKYGRVTEDMTHQKITIGVLAGDYDTPSYRSGVISADEQASDLGINYPNYEVGGGQYWLLNGIVEINCFFLGKPNEVTASGVALAVVGRVEKGVSETSIAGLLDDFGKRGKHTRVYARNVQQSGTPPEVIWRAKVYWAAYISVPFF